MSGWRRPKKNKNGSSENTQTNVNLSIRSHGSPWSVTYTFPQKI
nr:MAG TPA: hypothetical protein [Caudoviricetes sp.]DAN72268.1 MAG TPA: hypothetical protein [Caudoviricetes sp.]